ncbi:MAG TPA: hypothetical protein VF648_18915 [Pyrinomonadaceae bacterium]|jgi:hypothetical protein
MNHGKNNQYFGKNQGQEDIYGKHAGAVSGNGATAENVPARIERLENRIKELTDALDFYGIQVLNDGSTMFKPSVMKRWRKAENDTLTDEVTNRLHRLSSAILGGASDEVIRNYATEDKAWIAKAALEVKTDG